MNYLTTAIASFCASCIFIGALYMLCPDGNLSKSVKYALSLCFLVCVISAAGIGVKKINVNFDFNTVTSVSTDTMDNLSLRLAFGNILQENGINFKEITVFTDKLPSGSINITKVIIRSDCEKEKIYSALGNVVNTIEVEVVNE